MALVEDILGHCRGAFRRRDQVRWAALYLEGLLRPGARKTVAHLARTFAPGLGLAEGKAAQALEHFLSQSPWDEDLLLRHTLELLAPCRAAQGLLVVAEWAFLKRGRHSVGVQRQFSSALGRKANCQVAVGLLHAGPTACFPLALRLYLPRAWQQDPERLNAAGVPTPFRLPLTRIDLARDLLAASSQPPERVLTPFPGWVAGEDLERTAADRGLAYLPEAPPDIVAAVQACTGRLQELGLNHFEGRSWRGFHHHAALVMLAHACRLLSPEE